jgi:hypothetical protein
MRRHPDTSRLGLLAAVALIAGCGPKNHLDQYQFAERSLALSWVEPPEPVLLTGFYDLRPTRDPVAVVMRAGGGVAKDVEARRAAVRLDSATSRVDLPDRLAKRTLDRVSLYLGTHPVQNVDQADYVLEINMRRFGIDARSNHAAYLFTRAEAVLLDRHTGREIWNVDIRGDDRMTPFVVGVPRMPSSIFTAATISQVSVADFQEALEQLLVSSSNAITSELRDRLRKVRDY